MKWTLFTKLKTMWLVALNRTLRDAGMMIYMEGTYQRERQLEYSKEQDIIHVEQVDTISMLYRLKRTVVKQYVFNTTPETQTHENEEWYAVYHSGTRQLVELNHGRECSFHPVKSMLLLGNNAYRKIAKT